MQPIIFFSKKYNIEDFPDARKIHGEATPKLGGIAIFLSYSISLFFVNPFGTSIKYFFVAAFIIFILGLYDDLKALNAFVKIIIQIIATGFILIFFYKSGFYSNSSLLQIFAINTGILLWFLFFTNSINLIDGIDGLLSGLSIIILSAFACLFFIQGYYNLSSSVLILVLSIGGFWIFNLPKASIFMGDTGSLFIGFIISFLSIYYVFILRDFSSIYVIVSLGVIPILDSLYAIFRRLRKKTSPLVGDLDHFHHKLLKAGFDQNKTLTTFYFAQFLIVLYVFFFCKWQNLIIKSLILCVCIVLYLLMVVNLGERFKSNEGKLIKPHPLEYFILMTIDVAVVSYLLIPKELIIVMLMFFVLLYVYIFSFPRLRYLLNVYLILLAVIIAGNSSIIKDIRIFIFLLCMSLFLLWQVKRAGWLFIRQIGCQDIIFISVLTIICFYKHMNFYTCFIVWVFCSIFYLLNKRFLLIIS
jgi:UDP-GlcNAc:undecaprenyl-phosphate GlcNAc-1-phosphate transferase